MLWSYDEERTTTLSYKNITLTLYSQKGSKLLWCERDRWRQRQTAILTYNLFFWPYYTVLSSRPHLALLLLSQGLLNQSLGEGHTVGCCPSGMPSHSRLWKTAPISCGHLPISFHNTHSFPINHVTACFYRCVLCRESLIDVSVNGRYTTKATVCMWVDFRWVGCWTGLKPTLSK